MSGMRLCVIGNSHLAALKLGWEMIPERHAEAELVFFGSPLESMQDVIVEGRRLVAPTPLVGQRMKWLSGGLDFIDVDAYDVFFLHGLELKFADYFAHARKTPPSTGRRASADAVRRAWAGMDVEPFFSTCPSAVLAAKLKPFGKRVLVSPAPFPSARLLDGAFPQGVDFWLRQLEADGTPTPALAGMLDAWRRGLSRFDLLDQPAHTVVHGAFTHAGYSQGAKRFGASLDRAIADHDVAHMNAEYGRDVMLAALAKIAGLPAPAPIPLMPKAPEVPAAPASRETSETGPRVRHPYMDRPARTFWRRTVGEGPGTAITDWYRRKFDISEAQIATAGSCFAQHIGRRLRSSGFAFVDVEPAPEGLPAAEQLANGYRMYSARFGNVYTTRQLLQLFDRAFGDFTPAESVWEVVGGFVDPFRPTITAQPFASAEAVLEARDEHLAAVRRLFSETDVFVFTLGLTETWAAKADGAVYPVAPGVSGGVYDPTRHTLLNLGFADVMQDLRQFIAKVRALRKGARFILTVSPVPLMATATDHNVVVATNYSKSVLRAVAGQLADSTPFVDYFPSYEIINSHVMSSCFYEADFRGVAEQGVDHVMAQFFAAHPPLRGSEEIPGIADDEVVCDEILLAAFGGGAGQGERSGG